MIMNAFLPAVQMSGDSLEWLLTGQSIPSVYVNSTISSIAPGAFAYHSLPSTLDFPSCAVIGSHAFEGATNLYAVMSQKNPFIAVVAVDDYAFAYTSCNPNITNDNTNGLPECISIGSHAFEQFKGVMPMPKLTTIGDYAFYNGWLRSEQSFPSVVTIGNYAFASLYEMESQPGHASRLSQFIFESCISVGDYAFANNGNVYGEPRNYVIYQISIPICTTIGSHAFEQTLVTGPIYAPQLTYIPECAFFSASVSDYTIAFSKVSYIASSAFQYMHLLSSANQQVFSFPLVTDIGDSAFDTLQYHTHDIVEYSLYAPMVSNIGSYAFRMNNNGYGARLRNMYLPSCTSVGAQTFYDNMLSVIDMPELLSYGTSAFTPRLNSYLTQLSLPKISSIGASDFASRVNLVSVNIPSCRTFGSSAFSGCTALESVSCRGYTIYGYAFNNCTALSIANLTSVSRIYAYGFQSCKSMHTVAINYTGTGNIGSNTFRYCFNLLSLYLLGSKIMPLSAATAFTSTPISTYTTSTGGVNGSIFVPSSLYATYSTSTNWVTYAARFVSLTDAELASAKARFGIT